MAGGNAKDNKLQPSAKAFVPGQASSPNAASGLKASAKAWKPPASGEGAPAAAKPSAAAPAVASAWGKKPSNAIRSAPPPSGQSAPSRPQQAQRGNSRGGSNADSNGWKRQPNKSDKGGKWARGAARPDGNQKGDGQSNRRQRSDASSSNKGGGSRGQNQSGNRNDGGDDGGWARGKSLPVELLKPGEGTTDENKKVQRITAQDLLSMRLSFVSHPLCWGQDENEPGPPEAARWDSETRITEITAATQAPRMSGDVSQQNRKKGKRVVETAPPLEECKPLEVNDDTRWKANVFDKEKKTEEDEQSDALVLKKAFVILNKLSLTKFDKLSDDFINTGIGRNEECLQGAISLIVGKAQDEPHFSAMYAALCLKLARTPFDGIEEPSKSSSKKGKKFKKMLLSRCQEEFEQDTATKVQKATEGIDDDEEKEYEANKVKKHYLGHMRFIGELYKGDLISIKIMLLCLPALLEGETTPQKPKEEGDDQKDDEENEDEVDEEKVECFAKLMTVIGQSLEAQSDAMRSVGKVDASEKLNDCWNTVEVMAGKKKQTKKGPKVSNRIKFMLLDLIEMREKGWVTRRKEETAKTLAQIHKEVAKEERAAKRSSSSNSLRSMSSSGNIRRQGSSGSLRDMGKPQVDSDGFVSVKKGGMGRSMSMNDFKKSGLPDGSNFRRGSSSFGRDSSGGSKKNLQRSTSSGGAFAAFNEPAEYSSGNRRKSDKRDSSNSMTRNSSFSVPEDAPATAPVPAPAPTKTYLSPDECGEKAKNILKEYFVGGDTDDAVLSFDELIGAGKDDGSVARGAKVVENGCLLVLEMKAEDVEKFLTIAVRCIKESKIEGKAITTGLNDPLEFLSDIAIDAPLAGTHLQNIVAEFIKAGAISFDFLLNTPDYFRTDGNAAQFGVNVLKKIGGDALESESNIDVIAKLMTDEDKEQFPTAKELIAA